VWLAWRTVYHAATGGFVAVMLLFAMCLAGLNYRRLKWWLLGYWLLGPLGFLASGGNESLVGRWWAGGLLPIGLAIFVISVGAAGRQRALAGLSVALGVALLAGVHDYMLAISAPVVQALAPAHAAARVFLLHYAADVLLVVMGGILTARFVSTLQAIEQLNRTLETRVAEREASLAENYERLRQLERRHAAGEERQQIMRDLHDGVGSQLFLMLSRAEMGSIDHEELVQALRDCIADMRMTLEAMSPEHDDFLQAWSNFRFRWEQVLESSGIACTWEQDGARPVELSPHAILQLLRIVQEALTNVLKHAQAHRVQVRLHTDERAIAIEIRDDGRGLAGASPHGGHGLANMRARAQRLGARLDIADLHPGVRVTTRLERDKDVPPRSETGLRNDSQAVATA
jgi:signal transduction histidine kinase